MAFICSRLGGFEWMKSVSFTQIENTLNEAYKDLKKDLLFRQWCAYASNPMLKVEPWQTFYNKVNIEIDNRPAEEILAEVRKIREEQN